ncbi:hypothetical protein Tco_0661860 [Tanacetum coccineum]
MSTLKVENCSNRHFPRPNFVVDDFEADPRLPLILGRSIFQTVRTLIDEPNLNIIDEICEEYVPELLGFPSDDFSSGNPTSTSEPFTSEFTLEEIDVFLYDKSISFESDHDDCDSEEDIYMLEQLLNDDPFQLPLMDLKQSEVTEAKSSIEEPPELELKDLPSHLEYAFLEENDKLPVIIAKEEENEEQEEKEFDLEDILQIQDFILREKLLNVHRLISKIESLKNNPTPDRVLESPSPFPIPVADSDSFLEESDTSLSHLENSLPEFETFSDHTEETSSGNTTTHTNYSLPEYDSFLFEIEPDQEGLISIDNSNEPLLEIPEFESFHFDLSFPRPPPEPPDVCMRFKPILAMKNDFVKPNEDFYLSETVLPLNVEDVDFFIFIIWTFLPHFTYTEESPLIFSFRSENFVFDPGIITFHNLVAFSMEVSCVALPKDN